MRSETVSREGHINGVTFSLVGNVETVDAIIRFIKRLTNLMGGHY